jgi:hypothetical protein
MFRRVSWIVAFVLALSTLSAAPASASSAGAGTYEYHVGDTLVQDLGFPVGDQATASVNGDVVTVVATGTFDTATRSATGGGTFEHRSSGGTLLASATFTTTGMESFQFWGCGVLEGTPVPATWCGGRVQLTGVATAHPAGHPEITFTRPIVLTIECVIGYPHAGVTEGIRLNVQDHINFNKTVPESGANVFIRQ